jgi:hypothetical protein
LQIIGGGGGDLVLIMMFEEEEGDDDDDSLDTNISVFRKRNEIVDALDKVVIDTIYTNR